MLSPASRRVCTVAQEPADLPPANFDSLYRYTNTPVVIRNATLSATAQFRALTQMDALAANYGDALVTLSSANAFSYGRKRERVRVYLDSLPLAAEAWRRAIDSDDDQAAAQTFYWFGEHSSELQSLLDLYPLPRYVRPAMRSLEPRHSSGYALGSLLGLATAAAPLVRSVTLEEKGTPALSFGVAPNQSGVPFHFHNDGFSEVLHGMKRWLFYPNRPPRFRENATSASWLRHDYPRLPRSERPQECVVGPGDLLYFPNGWWHAIINEGDAVVFMSTFL